MTLDCKKIRESIVDSLKKHDLSDCTAVFIQIGDHYASNTYVNNKVNLCEKLGIKVTYVRFEETIEEEKLIEFIEKINENDDINGIMVQLPLPRHINEVNIINAIDPIKDIDGFTNVNKGKLMINDKSAIIPCTPKAIMTIIESQNIDLKGKNIVIAGRSNIVGKPLAQLMINNGATVTVCNSNTSTEVLLNHISNADIFISAIGKANYFNEDFCNSILNKNLKKCFAIDVGINRDSDNKLVGDISKDMHDYFGLVTPVPGGVGVMTVLEVIRNIIKCYNLQRNEGDIWH